MSNDNSKTIDQTKRANGASTTAAIVCIGDIGARALPVIASEKARRAVQLSPLKVVDQRAVVGLGPVDSLAIVGDPSNHADAKQIFEICALGWSRSPVFVFAPAGNEALSRDIAAHGSVLIQVEDAEQAAHIALAPAIALTGTGALVLDVHDLCALAPAGNRYIGCGGWSYGASHAGAHLVAQSVLQRLQRMMRRDRLAGAILLMVDVGTNLGLHDIHNVAVEIQRHADDDTNVIFSSNVTTGDPDGLALRVIVTEAAE